MTGTTPKARAIGAALRRAREETGLSARQLAIKLGKAHTTIGRWESGDRTPSAVDVATVLSALGVSNDLREEIIALAEEGERRRWVTFGDTQQTRLLGQLVELEREATNITAVSPLLIPGLLQTASYTRAIMSEAGLPLAEANMRVAVRTGRRDVLLRERPAELLAITSEQVLEQSIGGEKVMAEQLRALEFFAELPNVTLRVIPLRTGWHPGLSGPFTVREFKRRNPVANVESPHSGQFFHEVDDVEIYRNDAMRAAEAALSPAESTDLIVKIRKRREQ